MPAQCHAEWSCVQLNSDGSTDGTPLVTFHNADGMGLVVVT